MTALLVQHGPAWYAWRVDAGAAGRDGEILVRAACAPICAVDLHGVFLNARPSRATAC